MNLVERVEGWYRHPLATLSAYLLVVVLMVAALAVAFTNIRHLQDTQQRVRETQQELLLTTARLDRETAARLASVCDVALDNRDVVRRVVEVVESRAGPESALRDPRVARELDKLLGGQPVVCPRPPLEEGSQG